MQFWKNINTPTSRTNGGKPSHDYDDTYGSLRGPSRKPIKFISVAYTVTAYDSGYLLVANGGAATVITLPTPSALLAGVYVDVFNKVDQDLTINTTADKMITFNDVDADGIAFSTSSEKIGAAARFICDGAAWLVELKTQELQTVSVST